MRSSLSRWIGDADALRHLEIFRLVQPTLDFAHIRSRASDYYLSLVGELFDHMRAANGEAADWAHLGNALAQFAVQDQELFPQAVGVSRSEAALFAASAFYFGGFPASAYITIGTPERADVGNEAYLACFDLLARPAHMRSARGNALLDALRRGDMTALHGIGAASAQDAAVALRVGPTEWIPARLFEQLMNRFLATNIRAVLPDGAGDFWTPLVESLLDRPLPAWEFFPSQIQAIRQGLLVRPETFSLQMPTGSGKTALCETLLYWHAKRTNGTVAVMLVPYRSLASELRGSLVKRLNLLGISARCAYGGTVPTGDEVKDLDDVRVIVATPEALAGTLSADPGFFGRISLAICDEGHLLDSGDRGVGLELLLARMRARSDGGPRLVFVSAIVPNIEEIHSWLGGSPDTVVSSDYRPALAEFSVLRPVGKGASLAVDLEMHPHESRPLRFKISPFLRREDFQWHNPQTRRLNLYAFNTVKTQAIAAARKALNMGTSAVFAANKRGNQGAVGLAEELVEQLRQPLRLPVPATFMDTDRVTLAVQYLVDEYGSQWIGVQMLRAGAVLHHGDIPQETREVVEALLRRGAIRLAICTSTLAEGVNLPIRTLVLYSVQRRRKSGRAENLLARDVKNLVGRAGRAGATTKGLVICANSEQWPIVEQVARQAPGEPVTGALRTLVANVRAALVARGITLTNEILENSPGVHTLIDGIDATLIDLAAKEIGEEQLVRIAIDLADKTFASRQAQLESSRVLLQEIFTLRARRVAGMRSAGRLDWIRETGTRIRLLDSVERDLLPMRGAWDDVMDSLDETFVAVILDWAWKQRDLQAAIRDAYRIDDDALRESVRQPFFGLVRSWLSGDRFFEMAVRSNLAIDEMLGVHAKAVTFILQTLLEQAVLLLEKLLASQGRALADPVLQFPDHLRFGVPTAAARVLAKGLRHRRAAVELGNVIVLRGILTTDRTALFAFARQLIDLDRAGEMPEAPLKVATPA